MTDFNLNNSIQVDWRQDIETAIAKQPAAQPGRGGETPVGSLVRRVEALDYASVEMAGFEMSLVQCISTTKPTNASDWIEHCRLIKLVAGVLSPGAQRNLRDHLSNELSKRQLNIDARSATVLAMLDLHYSFTPEELGREHELERLKTAVWLDAWVQSGLSGEIVDDIPEFLSSGKLTLDDLMPRLPAWYSRMPDLKIRMPWWIRALPTEADQAELFAVAHALKIIPWMITSDEK